LMVGLSAVPVVAATVVIVRLLDHILVTQTEKVDADTRDILSHVEQPVFAPWVVSQTYLYFSVVNFEATENALLNGTAEKKLDAKVQARMTEIRARYGSRLVDVKESVPRTREPVSGWTTPDISTADIPGELGDKHGLKWLQKIWDLSVQVHTCITYTYSP
jgi:hypothetical protein